MIGNVKERDRYAASSNYYSDHLCLQLICLDLLATHLLLFCTSDSRKTPPSQHMALQTWPTNQVFVPLMVIV